MKKHLSQLAAAVLLAGLAAGAWLGQPPASGADQDNPGDRLETLIKRVGISFKREGRQFTMFIQVRDETFTVHAFEEKRDSLTPKGNDIYIARLFAPVFGTIPKGFKPPPAMLIKLAEFNDKLLFGSLGLSKSPEGEWSVWRNTSFVLNNADVDVFMQNLVPVVFARKEFRPEFQGFVDESK